MIASEALKTLCGMAYHPGEPPERWIKSCGIDPREVAGIRISEPRADGVQYCYLSAEGRRALVAYFEARRENWRALGISA